MAKDFVTPFMEYLVRLDAEAQAMFVNGVRAKGYQHQAVVMTNQVHRVGNEEPTSVSSR